MKELQTITTEIYHLQESPLYVSEKPYTMRYKPDGPIPVTNVTRERYSVQIRDVRDNKHNYSLKQHGFTIADLDTKMTHQDFSSHQKITDVYLPDLEKVLKVLFPGSEIDFISYLIRKRDAQFPYATGTTYTHGQPNIVAHIDATPDDLVRQITRRYASSDPSLADARLLQRCQYITLWKPLRGPLHDWPLALCDGNSVDGARDLEAQDIVGRGEVLENVHVYRRETHQWYYLSGQQADEVLVFRQADTKEGSFGTPHCAIANPKAPEGALPRESIEVVAFVYGGRGD